MDLARRLAGRTCIITGSGGSIGRATCLRFAAEGANVVGCDINPDGAEETVRLVAEAGGTMISIHPADLTNKMVCAEVVAAAVAKFGGVDVLFNNGAMAYFAWIEDMADETWYKTINQELDLVFLMTRAVWPELVKSSGAIVNVASLSAWAGIELLPGLAHSAAKGGVLSMPRELAQARHPRQFGIAGHDRNQPDPLHSRRSRMVPDPAWPRDDQSDGPAGRSRQRRGFPGQRRRLLRHRRRYRRRWRCAGLVTRKAGPKPSKEERQMVADHWVLERFRAVDRKDIDGFINMLTDDHKFVFGGRPPVIGKDDARAVVLHFWSLIGRLRHNIWRVTEAGEFIFVEANVDYERRDGKVVTVPCCDVIRTRGDKLCEQYAYLDQSPVWAEVIEGNRTWDDAKQEIEGLQIA